MFHPIRAPATLLLAVLAGGCAPAALLRPAASGTPWTEEREIAPGVRLAHRAEARGSWAADLVRVRLGTCGAEVRSTKALDRVEGRETVSAMAERVARATGRPVLAAVNADFSSFRRPAFRSVRR